MPDQPHGTPGTWHRTWEDEDGSPGWTFAAEEDTAATDERYAEVNGHGPYYWQVGEPWECGRVLFTGSVDSIDAAKSAAQNAFAAPATKTD
jgi:hypothetical protein